MPNERPIAKSAATGASTKGSVPTLDLVAIEEAIAAGYLIVEYQPKVGLLNTANASPFGVEALCRMHHPVHGRIPPDYFIPAVESSGLMPKLTDCVIRTAFRDWTVWKSAGLRLKLAINVSPVLLATDEWSQLFLRRCTELAIDPRYITLEITESAAGATSDKAISILKHLHSKGFSLSIDDFGTGFSSLSSLYRLPIAEMKIDKSFILDLHKAPGARALVESAIGMAKQLGIKVVAEGVESEEVLEELRRFGCQEVQGFFIGRSMPSEAVVPFFTDWAKKDSAKAGGQARRLPKVAILQALLNEIVNDRSLEPVAPAHTPYNTPYRSAPVDHSPHAKALVRKIPALVMEQKHWPALALCHQTQSALAALPECNSMRGKIKQLQAELEQDLLTSDRLEIQTGRKTYRLLPRSGVTLGRHAPNFAVDIPLNCHWLSAGEKHLRFTLEAGECFIEDMGSAHGYLLDGQKLVARRRQIIPFGTTDIELLQASGTIAPLTLAIRRNSSYPEALTIGFDYNSQDLSSQLGARGWADIKDDVAITWVLFQGKIGIGRSSGCQLAIEDCSLAEAAELHFEKGYWLTPAPGSTIRIDETDLQQAVPLAPNTEMMVGGAQFSIRRIETKPAVTAAKPAPTPRVASRF